MARDFSIAGGFAAVGFALSAAIISKGYRRAFTNIFNYSVYFSHNDSRKYDLWRIHNYWISIWIR